MYDMHCHILPGIDDGPSRMEEALRLVRYAELAGIQGILCTPHYMEDGYKSDPEHNRLVLESLKKAMAQRGIAVELYLGNEIYITPDILKLLDKGKISTLNGSRYILVEMPLYSKPLFTGEILFKLRLKGLIPILAHPERYEWIQKSPEDWKQIIDMGCLVQLNTASIQGYYGERIKKNARALLQENQVHLLGSDSHNSGEIYKNHRIYISQIQKMISQRAVKHLFQNAEAVVSNQEIGRP